MYQSLGGFFFDLYTLCCSNSKSNTIVSSFFAIFITDRRFTFKFKLVCNRPRNLSSKRTANPFFRSISYIKHKFSLCFTHPEIQNSSFFIHVNDQIKLEQSKIFVRKDQFYDTQGPVGVNQFLHIFSVCLCYDSEATVDTVKNIIYLKP